MLIELIAILLTGMAILWGVYFLKLKKEKNRASFILGYLYSLFGVVGIVTIIILMV